METSESKRSRYWLVWAVALPAVTLLGTLAVMSIPPQTGGVDIVAGQELYEANCRWCHTTRPDYPPFKAPNLHDIGRTAATRKPGQTAAEYILESIHDPDAFVAPSGRPGMPGTIVDDLSPNEVRNLIGYVAGLGATPNYEEINNLEIPDRRQDKTEITKISFDEMQLAEHVLRDKGSCLKCHSKYSKPESKVFAPGLFRSGLRNTSAIRESLLEPHKKITSNYESVSLMLTNGQVVSGQLVTRNDEHLVLCMRDKQNQLIMRDIPLDDIESEDGQLELRESQVSMMPEGFGKSLTEEEITAVIKLIRQLN